MNENGCGIVGRCKTRHGEGGAQVQVGRDGGNPVRVPADGVGGSGRAAVPPTATADPGGFSQPGGGETQETQRLGECGAQVQVGRDAGDPVRVPADGAGGSGRAAVPTPRPRTLEEFLNCKKGAPESVTRLKMERRVIASPDAADRKGWTSFIRV